MNWVSVHVFKDSVHHVGTTVMSPGEQPKALRRNKAWLMGGPDKGSWMKPSEQSGSLQEGKAVIDHDCLVGHLMKFRFYLN